jgi:hypothetical protein
MQAARLLRKMMHLLLAHLKSSLQLSNALCCLVDVCKCLMKLCCVNIDCAISSSDSKRTQLQVCLALFVMVACILCHSKLLLQNLDPSVLVCGSGLVLSSAQASRYAPQLMLSCAYDPGPPAALAAL